jgi:His-Xaa-Ser system protein HxsD
MTVAITVDLSIHPLDAVLRACHAFTGRCSVSTRTVAEGQLAIELTPRTASDAQGLAGDFSNALIDAHLRVRIAEETRAIRELLVAQAFCEADLLDRRDSESDEHEDRRGILR